MWQLTDDDGLPSNTVYNLLQDDKGYIWIGTSYGICRYDGKTFKQYTIPHFKDNEILEINKDNWSRIWATNLAGQFACIQNPDLIPIEQFKDKVVLDLCFVDNILWFAFRDSKKTKQKKLYGIGSIEFDEKGDFKNLLFQEERYKILHLAQPDNKEDDLFILGKEENTDRQSFIAPPHRHQLKILKHIPYTSISKTRSLNGQILFNNVVSNQIVALDNNNEFKTIFNLKEQGELNSFYVFDDYYLIASHNGLYYKTKSHTNQIITEHWLSPTTCNYVMLDREGNYWVTTDGKGIFVIPSLHLRLHAALTNSLPNDNVYSIHYDKEQDMILVGLDNGKIACIKKSKVIQQIDLPHNVRVMDIKKIDQAIWCLTDSGIFQIWEDGSINKISINAGKKGFVDSNKNLLIGSSSGLAIFNYPLISRKTRQTIRPSINLLNHTRIYALHIDKKNTLWLGTPQGLFLKKDTLQPFLENGQQQLYSISSIAETEDQSIWVATLGEGIFCIKDGIVTQRINKDNGLSSSICKTIFIDDDQLWVGTNDGINIIDLNNLKIRYFNKYDGLPSNEITALSITGDTAWVGTSKGLATFSKNLTKDNTIKPPVYITGLKIWDRDTSVYDSIYLQHYQNNLQIEYTGFGFSTQGNIRYKYKMEGLDPDWNLSSTNMVRYSSLPPGEYTFKVIAINEDNIESKAPAQMHLVVAVPWWDSYWFKILLSIGFVLGLSALYVRTSKQKARKQAFQNTVNELRMQALQTQVNPHFIFNALNAIQQFQVVNDREKAIDYLSQFAHLIRMIFEHSKEKAITLNQEIEFLKLYLELEKLRFKDKVSIDFHVSPELSASQQMIKVPPLLIQPIIENAFKHGLFHKGHDGKLNIDFQKKEDYLVCVVEDNGVGRAAAELKNLERNKDYQSSGLNTSEKRLKIYNRSRSNGSDLNQNVKITDLYNNKQEATGTKVEIRIRIKNSN